jgi:uncharacterized repeat protein (TIGR03803 family)
MTWLTLGLLLAWPVAPGAAQQYSVLHSFAGRTYADGATPSGSLTSSGDTLYGATLEGGVGDYGTLFRINTDGGGYTVLVRCGGMPDALPHGSLVLSGGRLYCATLGGVFLQGNYPEPSIESWGSVFSVNTDGEGYHRLVEWGAVYYVWGWYPTGPPGGRPAAGLVLSGETLYGTGQTPGASRSSVFRVSTNGQDYALIKDLAGLTGAGLAVAGTTLFGTTFDGGSNNLGTVFALDSVSGDSTALKHFTGADGAAPYGGVVLGGARLYGTTESGGQHGKGTVFSLNTNGTDFKVLRHFAGSDGSSPHGELWLAGDKLWGTTGSGGDSNRGTVYQMQINGTGFAVLKHFKGPDGSEPAGGVVCAGTALYGTTANGGDFNHGVVFRLSLAPTLIRPACAGTNFCFSFQTVSNLGYTVESSDGLTADWQFHHTLTGDGALWPCALPMTNASQQYYRVRVL